MAMRPSLTKRLKFWRMTKMSCPYCRVYLMEIKGWKTTNIEDSANYFCKKCRVFFDIKQNDKIYLPAYQELKEKGRI